MVNLSREYCAYFGEATEVWKRYVIGEIIVAFDEYRDSVCQTLQDAANSGANASTGGGQDVNNQEEMLGVLENAQQQAEQRIVSALNQTLNQPLPPPVSLSPVVSILANQTAQVNPPCESAISQAGINSGQNDADDNSLDISIKSEVDSSSESECESDTDDDEMQVKEEPNEDEEDITGRSDEQTENTNNNFDDNHETNHSQMGNSSNISLEFNSRSNPDNQTASDNEVDVEDDGDGNLGEDETVDNMETDENHHYDRQESDNEGSMTEEENAGDESDHLEDQVNMSGVEDNDEESTDDTTDEEQTARPSTSTGRRLTRQVSKRQTVANRQSKRQIKVKKTEPLSVITLKLNCTVPGCKKVVKSKSDLNGHLLLKHQLKEYRCLVRRCHGKVSTSFTTKSQLNDHRDQVHGSTTRWTCKCSKKFKNYQVLRDHYRHYHQLGLFACSKDGCTFKPTRTRAKVQNHQANHREARYECPVDGCGKNFKRKSSLDNHTLTHTGERPFPCPECDKSFTEKSTLTAHLRIHLNDKCFRCTWQQCTHSSANRSNIIAHIRTVHFKLPATKKKQAEENIVDDRDARDYLAKD